MAVKKRTHAQILAKDLNAIETIIKSIIKSQRFSSFDNVKEFEQNEMAFDASIRQVEVIGEAVKRLSSQLTEKHTEIEWSGLAKLRDRLIHQYDKIDSLILWDTIKKELPIEIPKLLIIQNQLKTEIKKIKEQNINLELF